MHVEFETEIDMGAIGYKPAFCSAFVWEEDIGNGGRVYLLTCDVPGFKNLANLLTDQDRKRLEAIALRQSEEVPDD